MTPCINIADISTVVSAVPCDALCYKCDVASEAECIALGVTEPCAQPEVGSPCVAIKIRERVS